MVAHDDHGEQDEDEHTDEHLSQWQIEIEAEFDADGVVDERTCFLVMPMDSRVALSDARRARLDVSVLNTLVTQMQAINRMKA